MDIDNTNFFKNLKSIIKSIQSSDFFAFDFEFTGFYYKIFRLIINILLILKEFMKIIIKEIQDMILLKKYIKKENTPA